MQRVQGAGASRRQSLVSSRDFSDVCVCVGEAEGGFLRGCEPRFDHLRNHIREQYKHRETYRDRCISGAHFGALCPSKSGLMNKHIEKHFAIM